MRVAISFLALGLFALLTACNTVEGMGRDVQKGGQAITGTANQTENQM